MKMRSLFLSSALVIIVIAGVIFLQDKGIRRTIMVYDNKAFGISLRYPSGYAISERTDLTDALALNFISKNSHILLVLIKSSTLMIANEKKFYEDFLFKDSSQTQNSHITVDNFSGFKALISFEQSRYTLYGTANKEKPIIIRSEITASSSDALLNSEAIYLDIIRSIKLY